MGLFESLKSEPSAYSHSASNYELVSRGNGRRIAAGNLNKKDRISRYLRLALASFSRFPVIVIGPSLLCPSANAFSVIVVAFPRHLTHPSVGLSPKPEQTFRRNEKRRYSHGNLTNTGGAISCRR